MYKNAPKKLQYSKNPRINPRIYLRLKFIYLFMIYIHLFICNFITDSCTPFSPASSTSTCYLLTEMDFITVHGNANCC